MTGYELSRQWFDWSFENPDIINPNHTALYFFIIEHYNRMGQPAKFGLPMEMAKSAIGIKNYRTYSKTFADLIEWGFIKVHQKSKNQYSANVIAIVENTKAHTKALSKATQKHSQKQVHGIVGINKPITKEPITYNNIPFDIFFDLYDKKVDRTKSEDKWIKLSKEVQEEILIHVKKYVTSTPDKKFRKSPLVYLNNKCWQDEIIGASVTQPPARIVYTPKEELSW